MASSNLISEAQEIENFKPQKGLMSRYAKKILTSSAYGTYSAYRPKVDLINVIKASNPKTTKPTLLRLAETSDTQVHTAIIQHHKTNAKILHKVFTHSSDPVIKDLILKSDKLTSPYKELIELGLS